MLTLGKTLEKVRFEPEVNERGSCALSHTQAARGLLLRPGREGERGRAYL